MGWLDKFKPEPLKKLEKALAPPPPPPQRKPEILEVHPVTGAGKPGPAPSPGGSVYSNPGKNTPPASSPPPEGKFPLPPAQGRPATTYKK